MTITPEQLAEWERLAGEASEAPWSSCHLDCVYDASGDAICRGENGQSAWLDEADASFIVAAREAVPVLIRRVRVLEHELQEARDDCWMIGCGPEAVSR